MGYHFLLQETFLTQELNPGLLHYRQFFLPSEPPGKPLAYHLIHAGCLPVQLCLPRGQKVGAGPSRILVIFVSSPYPAHSSVY